MKVPLLALMFALVAGGLGAEAQPHRTLLHFAGPEEAKYRPPLEALLTREPLNLWVLPSHTEGEFSATMLAQEARRFACDSVLTVALKERGATLEVTWALSSPEEDQPRFQGNVVKPSQDWAGAADLFWLFLETGLTEQFAAAARPWPAAVASERAEFEINARAGTLVLGLPAGPVTIDESGRTTVSLDLPVSLWLEGHLDGYTTTPERVFVNRAAQKWQAQQTPRPQWAVTVSLNNFAFPSLGGEWVPNGGRLATRFQIDQYLGGISLANRASGASSPLPFQSIPLMTLQWGAVWHWNWGEDAVQFYTGADLGLRWMFPQWKTFALEPVVPLTVQTIVGWDWTFLPRQSLYWELGPTFLMTLNRQAFLSSRALHSMNAEIELPGVPFYLEFPLQAKVGYRWSF